MSAVLLWKPRSARADESTAGGEKNARSGGETTSDSGEDKRESDYQISEKGRKFRVRFDPASRVSLTMGGSAYHDGNGSVAPAVETGFSFQYRKVYRTGAGEGRVFWQIDHQLVSGWVRPFVRPADGVPSLEATLYRATLLRHSESPSIVLPVSPPLTVGFPFDVGLDAELGKVTVPVVPVTLPGFEKPAPWVHLGVVHAAFTLDPWRPGVPGRALALGIGVRYDVDVYGAPTLSAPRFVHRIAPLTSGSARFRYQTDDGIWMMDVYAEATPHWTSENTWSFFGAAHARVDRTLIAINDQPIGAYADVHYQYLPEGAGAPALHDVRATLGVAASLSLK
ncbi:MAG: hypothetical protein IPK82_01765 [Polyangiaceae bacterium]|nr:hypothetical protein [Polyangiaceae bacterium]